MSVYREPGIETEKCPLIDVVAGMDLCQPCRFFRGASLVKPGRPAIWRVCCNWPRDGSYVAPDYRPSVPAIYTDAFAGDPPDA